MKTKSYALKPWWPRTPGNDAQPGAGATLPDRLALFRHQVALAARLLGVAVEIQDRVVAAVDQLPASSVRPDIGRQAQEWAAQHRTPRIYEK